MGALDATDQGILSAGFSQALGSSADKSSVIGILKDIEAQLKACCPGGTPPKEKTAEVKLEESNNEQLDLETQNQAAGGLVDTMKGMSDVVGKAFAHIDAGLKKLEDADKQIRKWTEFGTNFYDPIQQAMGGVTNDLKGIQNETVKATQLNLESTNAVFLALGDNLKHLDSELKTLDPEGKTVSILDRTFKTEQEVFDATVGMLNEFRDVYQLRYNEMNETQKTQLLTYEKGMGLSQQKIADMVKIQIQRTGEAGTQILEKVSAYSKQVAAATGVDFKHIVAGVQEIITNVKTFGNVQEDEAARIVGTLQQLGTSYRSFSNMVNKFMSFDTAASEIGKLTSVFGVHMDAMEMMQLANEDEEEFLHRMRDSFIDQGIAVDDLTKAQRNLLASTLNLEPGEVENFFDPDLVETGLDEMIEATEEASLATAFDDMIQNADFTRKSIAEMEAQAQASVLAPLRREAFATANAFDSIKKVELNKVMTGVQEVAEPLYGVFDKMNTSIDLMGDEKRLSGILKNTAGFEQIGADLESGAISGWQAVLAATKENAPKINSIIEEEAKKSGSNLITISSIDFSSAVGESAKNNVTESFNNIVALAPEYGKPAGIAYGQSMASAAQEEVVTIFGTGTTNIPVTAVVTTELNNEAIKRIDNISENQAKQKSDQERIFTKLTTGIQELAGKIVAKIEENRVVNVESVMNLDGELVFRTMRNYENTGTGEYIMVGNSSNE
jgi:hypothetical protein